jgi:hypothetical protein
MFAARRRLRAPNVTRNGWVPSNIGICEVNERSCSRDPCTKMDRRKGFKSRPRKAIPLSTANTSTYRAVVATRFEPAPIYCLSLYNGLPNHRLPVRDRNLRDFQAGSGAVC